MAKAEKRDVKNASTAKEKSTSSADPDNIDKIRDILFGSKERQYDQKFTTIEATIHKEISDLRSETKNTLVSLENYIKKELASLAEQLRTEQEERLEANEALIGKIDDVRRALEGKLSQLGDKTVAGQGDLQDQLLQQSKNLLDEIHDKHASLIADIERATGELRQNKTDRVELANMLIEVALRLKDEFQLPPTD